MRELAERERFTASRAEKSLISSPNASGARPCADDDVWGSGVSLREAKDGDVLVGVALHQLDEEGPQGGVPDGAQLLVEGFEFSQVVLFALRRRSVSSRTPDRSARLKSRCGIAGSSARTSLSLLSAAASSENRMSNGAIGGSLHRSTTQTITPGTTSPVSTASPKAGALTKLSYSPSGSQVMSGHLTYGDDMRTHANLRCSDAVLGPAVRMERTTLT